MFRANEIAADTPVTGYISIIDECCKLLKQINNDPTNQLYYFADKLFNVIRESTNQYYSNVWDRYRPDKKICPISLSR